MENDKRAGRDRIRLFLGVPVALATIESLGETAESLRRTAYASGFQVRWVPPVNYHVTLVFLGDTHAEVIEAIDDRLAPHIAQMPRFEFTVRGLGAFPRASKARVLWAGVDDPSGGLTELARVSADVLAGLGFAKEEREFHPHVTIGRLRQPDDVQSVLSAGLAGGSERNFSTTRTDFAILYESVMKPGSSEYVVRARYPLSPPGSKRKRQTEALQPSANNASEGASPSPDTGDRDSDPEAASASDE